MEIKKSAFVSSAASPGNRIKSHLKQIAVVGKSNVGKSSFINLLTNDGKLARTGKLPGRTRLINYFLINEEFFLTDLPGYGFARVSESGGKTEMGASYRRLSVERRNALPCAFSRRYTARADG